MGVERTVAVLSGVESVYNIDTFETLMEKIRQLAKNPEKKVMRIIADHIRAIVFMLADDKTIRPSNVDH